MVEFLQHVEAILSDGTGKLRGSWNTFSSKPEQHTYGMNAVNFKEHISENIFTNDDKLINVA